MPELPEVETTRQGLLPHVSGRRVTGVLVHEPRLRWPVSPGLGQALTGQQIKTIDRRAKYLLFRAPNGSMMVHLGMSGSLRIVEGSEPPQKHDHIDWLLDSGQRLRFHDPRHEATSRLFEKGLSIMQVASSITGHKTLRLLKRYTHPRAEDLAAKLG